MVYVDTSVLLALFINEAKTADAWRWFNRQMPGTTVASDWTLTEIASALSVKRRMHLIDDPTHAKTLTLLGSFIQTQLAIITPDYADFHHAARLCDNWRSGLRAGDALHVGIAERRRMAICTLDRVMHEAAVSLAIPVEMP
jgi:uncharacterized protein